MLRVIRETRPSWVIGENVAGITSMVQPGSEVTVENQASSLETSDKETLFEQEYVIETVCRDLEREGYSVQPILIPACGVGAPHRRDRVWFIANRTNSRIEGLRQEAGKTKFMNLSLLPTPTAQEGFNSGKGEIFVTRNNTIRIRNQNGTSSRLGLEGEVKHMLYPTPTMRDYQPSVSPTGLVQQNGGKTSRLNPLFVEEMMGYPLMWTTLPFLTGNGEKNQ